MDLATEEEKDSAHKTGLKDYFDLLRHNKLLRTLLLGEVLFFRPFLAKKHVLHHHQSHIHFCDGCHTGYQSRW